MRADEAAAQERLAAAWPGARPSRPCVASSMRWRWDTGCSSWVALKAALDDIELDGKTHAEWADQLLRHGWDGGEPVTCVPS